MFFAPNIFARSACVAAAVIGPTRFPGTISQSLSSVPRNASRAQLPDSKRAVRQIRFRTTHLESIFHSVGIAVKTIVNELAFTLIAEKARLRAHQQRNSPSVWWRA